MNLCQFSNIFGSPNTGLHAYKIFGIAVVDVILTILAAIILANLFKLDFWLVLAILFVLGIIAHRLFCVRTAVDMALFPNC